MLPALREDLLLISSQADRSKFMILDPVNDRVCEVPLKYKHILEVYFGNSTKNEQDLLNETANEKGDIYPLSLIREVVQFTKNAGLTREPQKEKKSNIISRLFHSYMMFKIPFGNPNNFLNMTSPLSKIILNKVTISILTFLAIFGYSKIFVSSSKLKSAFEYSLSYTGLFYLLLTLFLIKGIHELSHMYLSKAYGARVKEFGVALIFFQPRFFCDLSDNFRLSRKQRFLCSFAGIYAELILGGLACYTFIAFPLTSAICKISYWTLTISVISTLLMNGNPLMKFDGYRCLVSLCNVTDLYAKGMESNKTFWRFIIFGIAGNFRAPATTTFLYGLCTFIYRHFLYISILVILYRVIENKKLALLIGAFEVFFLFFIPYLNGLKSVIRDYHKINIFHTTVSFLLIFSTSSWLLAYKNKIEVPAHLTYAETIIYAPSDCSIGLLSKDSLQLKNESLLKEAKLLEIDSSINKLKTAYFFRSSQRILHQQQLELMKRIEFSIQDISKKRDRLLISFPQNEYFILDDKKKVYYKKGERIGRLIKDTMIVDVFVPQEELKYLVKATGKLYFTDSIEKSDITFLSQINSPTHRVPNILLDTFGGRVPTLASSTKSQSKYVLLKYSVKAFSREREAFVEIESTRPAISKLFISLVNMCKNI